MHFLYIIIGIIFLSFEFLGFLEFDDASRCIIVLLCLIGSDLPKKDKE